MKKKTWIIIIIIAVILIGVGAFFYFRNNQANQNDEGNYEAEKTATNEEKEKSEQENEAEKQQQEKEQAQQVAEAEQQAQAEQEAQARQAAEAEKAKQQQYQEETITTFSTKIYSKDQARQTNIQITCNTLNDTIVKKGETFSFCNTVGKATTAKGYQKADVYDRNGNKQKGLGGGNCQISSTLYNAVLNVSGLTVTERHEHSNNVPYVPKGKDAAVAYGSYDFKFRNDTENDIKIKSSTDSSNVTVSLVAMKAI